MMPKLLEGVVEEEAVPDPRIATLEAEVRRLNRALADALLVAERAQDDARQMLMPLRRQLHPLYQALQALWGEIEAAGVEEEPTRASAPPGNPRTRAIWDAWQRRLPGYPARIIEALLLHREMNTSQLAIAVGCHKQRISEGILKLNKAGLINKNAGRFSLKDLA